MSFRRNHFINISRIKSCPRQQLSEELCVFIVLFIKFSVFFFFISLSTAAARSRLPRPPSKRESKTDRSNPTAVRGEVLRRRRRRRRQHTRFSRTRTRHGEQRGEGHGAVGRSGKEAQPVQGVLFVVIRVRSLPCPATVTRNRPGGVASPRPVARFLSGRGGRRSQNRVGGMSCQTVL